MKVFALGCGEMGKVAIKDLVEYGDFDEVVVGDIDLKKTENFVKKLKSEKTKVSAKFVDVTANEKLVNLMSDFDVVLSCVGPFYKFALPVVNAAIQARVDLVDICDDYDSTSKVLELDSAAKDAGITVVSGLGVSPGASNILAKAAAEMLDEPEEVHIALLMGAPDLGGVAEISHRFHSMYGKVPTFQNGKFVEVRAFVDGKETVEFPEPFGKFEVFHIGHPEPITIPRYMKKVKYVDVKCVLNPPSVKDLIVSLGDMGFSSEEALDVKGASVRPLDFAAAFVYKLSSQIKDVPKLGAMRVEVRGMKSGKKTGIVFASTGKMDEDTGIPVSIGAQMLAEGKIKDKGVFAPEGCIDPSEFITEFMKREPEAPVEMTEYTTTVL